MKRLQYFFSVFLVASRRLWHQRGLALSMLVGLVAAVALTVSIPIYSDAVSYRILHEKLYSDTESTAPPFSFLFRYVGSWHGYLEWEECTAVNTYITNEVASVLGLPQEMLVRHFKTDKMRLFPSSQSEYDDAQKPIAYVSLGFVSDLEPRIDIVDGQFPRPVANNTEPIEVLVSSTLVEELGIQVGETYVVYYPEPMAEGAQVQTVFQHPVRIAGVWEVQDPQDPFWFYQQSAFEEVLLMPESSYVQTAQGMKGEVGLGLWWLILNGDAVRANDANSLWQGINLVHNKSNALLNDIELARSPEDALISYGDTVRLLTIVLYVFSLPILGLVLYFISLIGTMIVQRQRNEVAMLRSRGTTVWQVVGIYLLEGLIIGGLSMVAGAFLGERFAQAMGLTRSFLVLENRAFLPTVLSWTNLRFGIVAVVASILASVGPALRASKSTIVTYKQEQARSLEASWWQRIFLDVILLVPALYGYYLLEQRGTISFVGESGAQQADSPFSNPFLFLVPVLFVFALALFSIRVFPWIMRLLAWLANLWKGAVPVLALRHLSRTARQYTGPLLLLTLTLSLAVFTASMARTLDQYIVDQVYYRTGADFRLIEMGQSTSSGAGGMFGPSGGTEEDQESEDQGPTWLFLPVSEHLNIPGVNAATRVWDRPVVARLGGGNVQAKMVGIDRIDFPKTAFFRRDFAPASSGALMNALAVRNDAILVSREILSYGIQVGDKINIAIPTGLSPRVDFTVTGVVDLFPRLYPEDGPFFVANLDFIFDAVGGMHPYDVWLDTEPYVGSDEIKVGTENLGINLVGIYEARQDIDDLQLEPSRQGVFGLLSVGFIVSAFLTVLGFLIYSYVSFLQRYIELGVLRAVGLSLLQMAMLLIAEQLTLILTGAAVGTGLGVLVSRLFIPFLQVESGEHPFTPPFVVQIAWTEITYIYAVFGVMFVAAVIVLLFFLRRMRIFEAVKLGETT